MTTDEDRARLQAALDEANKSLSAFIDLFGRTDAYADVLLKAMRAIVGRSQNGTLGTSKVDDMRRLAEDAIAAAPKATADADWVAVKLPDLLEAIGTLRGFHRLTGDASLEAFADRLAAQLSPTDRAALPANTDAVDFMSAIEALRKASVELANLGPEAHPSRVAEAKSRYVDCVNSLHVLAAQSRFHPLDDHK
ncbi:MAG: hypothetical protein IBJ15_02180 [Alphaproteobacteria bacterium]|nr:hypothetical protein [Alphaproteobacteria bacterium]